MHKKNEKKKKIGPMAHTAQKFEKKTKVEVKNGPIKEEKIQTNSTVKNKVPRNFEIFKKQLNLKKKKLCEKTPKNPNLVIEPLNSECSGTSINPVLPANKHNNTTQFVKGKGLEMAAVLKYGRVKIHNLPRKRSRREMGEEEEGEVDCSRLRKNKKGFRVEKKGRESPEKYEVQQNERGLGSEAFNKLEDSSASSDKIQRF